MRKAFQSQRAPQHWEDPETRRIGLVLHYIKRTTEKIGHTYKTQQLHYIQTSNNY